MGVALRYTLLSAYTVNNVNTVYTVNTFKTAYHNIHALAAVDWGQVELLGTPLSDMTRNDDQLTFLDVEGLSPPF